MMRKPKNQPGRARRLLDRLERQLRLQRELLWHPRLGLVGARQPVIAGGRRLPRRPSRW